MWLRRRLITVALVAVGGLMAAAPSAFGAQSDNASCVGAGSSSIAPGHGFGYPGERADIAHYGQTFGVPPGQLVGIYAHQKGSAAECYPEGPPLPPG